MHPQFFPSLKLSQFVSALLALVFCCLSLVVFANKEYYEFENDEQRQRFQRFTYDLACPVCQGQSLAGSNADIANDLKRELHRLILEGKSDDEIVDFMVSRYGDFVMFKPRMQANTYVLWFGPPVLLLIGAMVFVWVMIKKQRQD